MKKVLVSVLNYNGEINTKSIYMECIESLKNQTFRNFAIMFIDNNSTDGSYGKILKSYNNIYTYKCKKNIATMAYNIAIKKFLEDDYDYLLLSNNDIVYDENFVENMVSFAEKNPSAGILTPKIMMMEDNTIYNSTGIVMNKTGYCWDRDFGRSVDNNHKRDSGEVLFASGAAMFIKKDAILKTGFFDRMFYAYYEDVDISMRLRKKTDYKIYFVNNAVCYHMFSASWKNSIRKEFFMMRNRYFFVIKHFPWRYLINALRYLYFTSTTGDSKTDRKVYLSILLNLHKLFFKRINQFSLKGKFPKELIIDYHGLPRMNEDV